ncbi:universal stress protein [Methanocella paludicola]|nr:universal stress protein [Methanocella paludicola]
MHVERRTISAEEGILHDSVVVPISRPETIESIVNIACDMLADDGTLRLLYVIEVPYQLPLEFAETRKTKATELLAMAADHSRKRGFTPRQEVVVARDIPQAILDMADRYKADLILMGSSQRSVPEKVLFGSIVGRVLREAPCEVIVYSYPKTMQPIKYDRILVPTSGFKHAWRALDIALHFQMLFGSSVASLYVGDDRAKADQIQDSARTHAEQLGSKIETLYKTGSVVDTIVDIARSGGYTLIIIGSTERPSYYKFLLGSTADEVVTRAPCNVLIVRTKK